MPVRSSLLRSANFGMKVTKYYAPNMTAFNHVLQPNCKTVEIEVQGNAGGVATQKHTTTTSSGSPGVPAGSYARILLPYAAVSMFSAINIFLGRTGTNGAVGGANLYGESGSSAVAISVGGLSVIDGFSIIPLLEVRGGNGGQPDAYSNLRTAYRGAYSLGVSYFSDNIYTKIEEVMASPAGGGLSLRSGMVNPIALGGSGGSGRYSQGGVSAFIVSGNSVYISSPPQDELDGAGNSGHAVAQSATNSEAFATTPSHGYVIVTETMH